MKEKGEKMQEELVKIMVKIPDLGICGFNDSDGKVLSNKHSIMFEKCNSWLSECQKNKTATTSSPDSYQLKHLVENDKGGYIASGIFIASAIHNRIPVKRCNRRSHNAYIGISKKSQPVKYKI